MRSRDDVRAPDTRESGGDGCGGGVLGFVLQQAPAEAAPGLKWAHVLPITTLNEYYTNTVLHFYIYINVTPVADLHQKIFRMLQVLTHLYLHVPAV